MKTKLLVCLTEHQKICPSNDTRCKLGVFKVSYLVIGLFLAGKTQVHQCVKMLWSAAVFYAHK